MFPICCSTSPNKRLFVFLEGTRIEQMGRLTIFSRSSGKESNSSDVSRSWTLSRAQSLLTIQSRPQKQAPPGDASSDERAESKDACITTQNCDTNGQSLSEENCKTLPGQSPQKGQKSSSSGGRKQFNFASNAGYSSRRFADFKTLFRSRKHKRKRLNFDILEDDDVNEDCQGEENSGKPHPTAESTGDGAIQDQTLVASQPGDSSKNPSDEEARKVSDTTEKSAKSSNTNATICHHPSKRMSMPITVADQDLAHPGPFDDSWEISRSETHVSNPFSEPTKSTESTERSSSGYSGSDNPFSSFPEHTSELSSSSDSSWCCPTLSGFNGWPTPADRRLATDSFNKLAGELYLDPLGVEHGASHEDKTGEFEISSK